MSDAEITLRPLVLDDIPRLVEIRPTYVTDTILAIERSGVGLTTAWRLVERKLSTPFDKGNLYNFGEAEQELVRQRLRRPEETYQSVAELDGRLIGLVEVELQEWNDTAWLANLMIDLDYRRQGLGRRLWHRGLDFAREAGVRAMMIETQNTNLAACKFYERMGCQLVGLNEVFYTNDGAATEIALFWAYFLTR
jgi:streptothricin acetyltransferase